MIQILIIADDLTGALDFGVAFTRSTHKVLVAHQLSDLPKIIAAKPDVICINTASREGSADDAVAKIKQIAQMIDLSTIPYIFKKIDSRLKGHVLAETNALMQYTGSAHLLAAPAIPEMGRIQLGGYIQGNGIDNPIKIADYMPTDIHIPDITNIAEIQDVVKAAPAQTLWIGARGLAFALADHIFTGQIPLMPTITPPFMIAIGSRDPITVAQIEQLALDNDIIYAPNGQISPITQITPITCIAITAGAKKCNATQAGMAFAQGITQAALLLKPKSLLLSGGETAQAIFNQLGIKNLEICTEIQPGLPLCRADSPWGRTDIITKSGGFGKKDLLAQLALQVKMGIENKP